MRCSIVFQYQPANSRPGDAAKEEAVIEVGGWGAGADHLPMPSVGEDVSYYTGGKNPVVVARRVRSREFHYGSGLCRVTIWVTDIPTATAPPAQP